MSKLCYHTDCCDVNKNLFVFVFRALDWRERAVDGPARSKYDKIVIFKHLFDPKEFDVICVICYVVG